MPVRLALGAVSSFLLGAKLDTGVYLLIVDREGGHSFGHLNFKSPDEAMRARVIIDRHFEENPEWGVLTNYKLSKRTISESVTQSDT